MAREGKVPEVVYLWHLKCWGDDELHYLNENDHNLEMSVPDKDVTFMGKYKLIKVEE
jgi:hypothetical protein